jgi:hypothetical protein
MPTIDDIVITGDLSQLTEAQQTQHYLQVCAALGLDYHLHPLEYIFTDSPNGGRKLILYVLRAGSDALRKLNGVDIIDISTRIEDGVVTTTAKAKDKTGRTDIATGAVSIQGKNTHERANAIMASETKAKRRVTLSLSGCGLLDETEVADLTSKITVVDAGIGVSAAPQLVVPKVSQAPAKDVTSALPVIPPSVPESVKPIGKDPRITKYKFEVLQAGGMQSEVGKPIGLKWSKFLLGHFPGKKSLGDLTPEEWKSILDKLDEVRAITGDKGVVFHVEEFLAKAGTL